MKTVYFLRHSLASNPEMVIQDSTRELTEHGKEIATKMGIFLSEQGVKIDKVISSTAIRACSTAELVAKELQYPSEQIDREEALYRAEAEEFLQFLYQITDDVDRVLIVAHNPTITKVAQTLVANDIAEMNPCSVIGIQSDRAHWFEIDKNNCTVILSKDEC